MRARSLILLLFAVLLAGGTAFLTSAWLKAQRSKELTEATPMALPTPAKSVLVARTDIKRGQILRPDEMVWQTWPEGGLDKSYIVMGGARTPESFAGWVAKNPIAGGEPINEGKIIAPGNRGFLAAVLRPGMRAISIPVTITSGISGFIFPGDEVDLMLTYTVPSTASDDDKDKKAKFDHKAAETVLRTIRVVAIDQRLDSKAGEAVPAHTATFEVTPKQSEVILLASEIGKVSLILRSLVPDPPEEPTAEPARADAADTDGKIVASRIAANTTIAGSVSAVPSDRTSGSSSAAPVIAAQAVTVLSGPPSDSAPVKAPATMAQAAPPAARAPDTSPGASATYTLDHEISKLFPQPKGDKEETPEPPKLWVCKGPALSCSNLTADSAGDRFLAAFKEMKSQGATFTPGRQ